MRAELARESLSEFYVVDEEAGCWVWNRGRSGGGYGRYRGKPAHRAVWILFHGPIPDGLFICHHCDNPPCVKPEHLFLGTPGDNMQDCIDKGRMPHVPGTPKFCAVAGCGRIRTAKGFCGMHYTRWRAHGDPLKKKKPGTHADNV